MSLLQKNKTAQPDSETDLGRQKSLSNNKIENFDKLLNLNRILILKNGVWLGLSICINLVEQMRGSVDVKSKLNKETSFNFNIKTFCKLNDAQL